MGDVHVSVVMGAAAGFGALRLSATFLGLTAAAYSALCAFFSARFLWRAMRLLSIRRESVQVQLSGDAAVHWTQYSRRFRVHHPAIAASSRVSGPVTMGLTRKLVLLPVSMVDSLPDCDLDAVIAHEFAHMRRNDFLKNLLYELLAIPVGYHPLLWLTRRNVMQTREMVCDEMAAEITGRTHYARSLLRLAYLLVRGTPSITPNTIGIFDGAAFERRLMRLAREKNEIHGIRRAAIVTTCTILGLGACTSALALRMHVDASAASSSTAKSGKPLTVPSGEMAGNKLSGPNPIYPVDAKKARIQGKVVLSAVIGKDGTIKNLRVLSGPRKLRQSSLDAVRQWTYKPYLLNGTPVEVQTTVNVIYSLRK